MDKINLPKVGLRNIKTALAVFICIIVFPLFNEDSNPFYACIAAVICMKDTIPNTFKIGIDRIIGTVLGGIMGIIFIFLIKNAPNNNLVTAIASALGIVILIYICTCIKKPGSVTISCIVLIGVILNHGEDSYSYAIFRSIDTTVGIVIAYLVNKYINPPKEKELCIDSIEKVTNEK